MPTSLLASAVLNVALKIHEKIEPRTDISAVMSRIISFAQLDITESKLAAKEMLAYAKDFEKIHPNFKNLKAIYSDEFKSFKPSGAAN